MSQDKDATIRAIAPGRVNLLGEHVDYNGGPVLPAAIDRAVHLSARQRADRVVALQALDIGETVRFSLDDLSKKVDLEGKPLPGWARYPAGVAWVLQNQGYPVKGLAAAYTSNVPIGAGLSSSAAVELAFAVTWRALGDLPLDQMTLVRYAQMAENQYVGMNCGIMDQFASAMGVAGHALYFDTRSLAWEPVPLPPGSAIVIADSGVRRSLTNSAYNERRADCEAAVELLQPFLPGIRLLRDVTPDEFDRYADRLPERVRRHARHVVEECARVDQAFDFLKAGDAASFGQLMYAGHASLRDLYEVSTSEQDRLVEIAGRIPGCWGARLTGAGFGGCTVNLVREGQAEAFIATLKEGYRQATGREAQVYLCHASEGARIVKDEG